MGRRRGAGQGGVFLDPGEWKQAIRREEFSATQQERDLDPNNVEPLRKYLVPEEVKEVEGEDERVLRFTISTASVDRDRDTISVDGWDLANYLKNPVVLFGHDYGDLPVGKSLNTFIEDGKLKSDAQFPSEELYPFGYTVYQMYLGGYMRATSVGFLPTKWAWVEEDDRPFGVDFEAQELLEYSCVPVPSNPEALHEARSKGINTAPLKDWAEQVLDGERGPGLWVPRKAVEDMVKVLGGEKSKLSANWQNVLPLANGGVVRSAHATLLGQKDGDGDSPDVAVGDFVEWNSSGGSSQGKVDMIVTDGEVPGTEGDSTVTGTEDDPAARVVVWQEGESGWEPTDTKVGHKTASLTKIDPLKSKASAANKGHREDRLAASEFLRRLCEIRMRAVGVKGAEAFEDVSTERIRREANFLAAKLLPDVDAETFEKLFPEVLGGDPGEMTAAKSGRVLSKANESKVRAARDELDAVLIQLEGAQEVEDDGTPVEESLPEGEAGGKLIDLSSLDPARVRSIVGEEVRGEVGRLRGRMS